MHFHVNFKDLALDRERQLKPSNSFKKFIIPVESDPVFRLLRNYFVIRQNLSLKIIDVQKRQFRVLWQILKDLALDFCDHANWFNLLKTLIKGTELVSFLPICHIWSGRGQKWSLKKNKIATDLILKTLLSLKT